MVKIIGSFLLLFSLLSGIADFCNGGDLCHSSELFPVQTEQKECHSQISASMEPQPQSESCYGENFRLLRDSDFNTSIIPLPHITYSTSLKTHEKNWFAFFSFEERVYTIPRYFPDTSIQFLI